MSLVPFGASTPLRTDGASLYFAPIDPNENDVTDSHFIKVRGRNDSSCVSFESVKWPGHFLRGHGPGNRVELSDAWWDPWFNPDTTFCPHSAASSYDQQYESQNNRGYFLARSGGQLVLSPFATNPYGANFVETEPFSLGRSLQWADWTYRSDGTGTLQRWGRCTGITPFWAPRTTSIIATALSTGRIVSSVAFSTSYIGFYPRITFTGMADHPESIYTIRTEVLPCL